MEKKFSSKSIVNDDSKKATASKQVELSNEKNSIADLTNQVADLKQKLKNSLENEHDYIQQISNLEMQQHHFFEERKKYLMQSSKSKNSELSSKIISLDEEVQKLTLDYFELSSQNKSLHEKLKETEIFINKQIKEAQSSLNNAEKRLKEEKSFQESCDKAIQRLDQQIQKINSELEILSSDRIINNQRKKEIDHQTEQSRTILEDRLLEMQNLQIDLENSKMRYESLLIEKEQRFQSIEKKTNYDQSQIMKNIRAYADERKRYEKKIKKLKEEEISNLNYQIEKGSQELKHLIQAHEIRKRKQFFIENEFDPD